MFFDGKIFWLLNGILFILIAVGFKAFADERNWKLTWWKGALATIWYIFFSMAFYALGTLIGENEASAGYRMFAFLFVVALVLGVGLWRLLAYQPKPVKTE